MNARAFILRGYPLGLWYWHEITGAGMKLEEALAHYDIGRGTRTEPIVNGIIHKTWKVATDRDVFVLQQVNPIFAPSVMQDIAAVLAHLKSHGCLVMEIVKTKHGELFVPDETGFWRLFTYIPGRVYNEREATADVAHEAGKLLGRYHNILDSLQYEFAHVRAIKHNIPLIFAAYQKAVAGNRDPEIAPLLPIIDRMPTLDLPLRFRKHAHHGDAKISNFIFSEHGEPQAVAMVDFDDCGWNYNILHELGGFFRSVCWLPSARDGRETFSLAHFERALEGYAAGAGKFLTAEEWQYIPHVLQLNLLQLASRFVRDYFEDSYFTWDPAKYPSRTAHNLARAQTHVALYEDIARKEQAIREIVNRVERTV